MVQVCLVKPCSSLCRATGFHSITGSQCLRPRCRRLCRAEPNSGPSSSADPGLESKEASLEGLEASLRGKAVFPRSSTPVGGLTGKPAKPIPIRGVSQQTRNIDSQYENMAEWREWQLFPEGWESMSLGQKFAELYLGRRGVLFWANKAAYASVFVVLGGWILFRIVGPALGLYKLTGE